MLVLALTLAPAVARAQSDDAVGVRAQGMAGAFTAVAEDATATWWNPAGLAGGAYFSATLEVGHWRQPTTDHDSVGAPKAAWRIGTGGFSIAFPALGLSYYQLKISEIQPIVGLAGSRQEQGTAEVGLRSLVMSQFGVTTGQSVGQHLVVGSTLKLVRGTLAGGTAPRAAASLDAAAALQGEGETHAGLDVGVMAVFGVTRFGVAVRNVRPIHFGSDDQGLTLRRHARAGAAVSTSPRALTGGVTVAVDADLTKTATVFGDERRVAAGVEAWSPKRWLGVRGGVGINTLGQRRAAFSGGGSVAFRSNLHLDGAITRGGDESRRGWGGALRVTF